MEVAHIAIVPSPGMGHLIPFAEFSKLLVSRFPVSVSLLIPTLVQAQAQAQSNESLASFLSSLPSTISHIFLPPVDPAHLPDGAPVDVVIPFVMAHSTSSVRAELTRRPNVVALVTDLFGTCHFDVARELRIPPYIYFTCSATYLLFCFHLPRLDETVSCEYKDMSDPLVLPGCVPIYGKDFEDAVQDRQDEAYKMVLDLVKGYVSAEGILVNSFFDLEHGAIRALQTKGSNWPPVYPIGPIIRSEFTQLGNGSGSECLRWLDQQPSGSVLFVCFGSGGTLSYKQLNELAIGLEKSRQRFLWVVRGPNEESSSGSYFGGKSEVDDVFDFLPEEFSESILGRGLLVPCWAPQIEVLRHRSTGGFLTHCGWNSTLESIIHGVPLITWPLFAEQRMNAVMLSEGLKVRIRPNPNGDGIVEAGEIAKVVKDLMEGNEVRNQMEKLSELAKKALNENGNSSKLLKEVTLKWTQKEILEIMKLPLWSRV